MCERSLPPASRHSLSPFSLLLSHLASFHLFVKCLQPHRESHEAEFDPARDTVPEESEERGERLWGG